MALYKVTKIYNKDGTYYIQAWVNNTLYIWQSKIDIYLGKYFFQRFYLYGLSFVLTFIYFYHRILFYWHE